MKLLFLLLLISTSFFGQCNNEIQNQKKFKNYTHLDSINLYSKEYSTKIIEGSGFIKNKKNKNIGSIGYSIELTTDKNGKTIRILKSESTHYEKYNRNPKKNIISEITIYFDEFQQPDLAKYISKTFISNSLVTTKTKLFDLKQNNEDTYEFLQINGIFDEIKDK
jgi:hypothetical protein